jgi:tetratricopeptide (TPR) repeat protein
VLVKLGKFDEAVARHRTALKALPGNPDICYNLGLALAKGGNLKEGVEWLGKTLQAEPGHAGAHANLGVIHSRRGEYNIAAHHFAEALRSDPDHTMARRGLAAAMLQQQDGPEILATLRKSFQARPNAALHRALGDVLAHQGEFEEALRHYRQAVRLRPEWPPAAAGLAWHLATSPRPELRSPVEAERLALSACQWTGYDAPYPLIALGAAFAAQGKFPQAVNTAGKAMSLAKSANDAPLAKMIAEGIRHYRAGRPYRQVAPDKRRPSTRR